MCSTNLKIITVVLCTASLSFTVNACAQQYDQAHMDSIAQEEQKNVGDIDLRGVVLSEEGVPLKDVSVEFRIREYGDVVTQVPPTTESMTADGVFGLRRGGISSISVSISKDGYYGETWQYNFSADNPRNNPDGFELIDIEVVLKKKPKPAPLEEFEGTLRTGWGGPISTLGISKSPIPPVPLEADERKAWKARQADLPVLYLEATTDGLEGFRIAEFRPRGQSFSANGLAFGKLMHTSKVPDDGFLVFDPGEVPVRHRIVFRNMNVAPVDGYSPSIDLSAADGPEVVYFFFRIAGRYGKGMVSGRPAVFGDGETQEARASAVVFSNPNGSRDVAYFHD